MSGDASSAVDEFWNLVFAKKLESVGLVDIHPRIRCSGWSIEFGQFNCHKNLSFVDGEIAMMRRNVDLDLNGSFEICFDELNGMRPIDRIAIASDPLEMATVGSLAFDPLG